MENREKQLQELKKEYQDIHMSEEQLLQMKLKISQAKQENSRQGSNAAHSSVSHRRSITRRCGIAAAAAAAALDRKSTRLNSSHWNKSRMPSSA